MSLIIEIHNVSELTHRRLKARAAMEGVSVSEYVLAVIERALELPSRRDLLAATRRQSGATLDPSPADLLRAGREARAKQLDAAHRCDLDR